MISKTDPPQESDTDMQAVKITRTDFPKLLRVVEVMMGALEWYAIEGRGFYTEAKLNLRAKATIKEVKALFGDGK